MNPAACGLWQRQPQSENPWRKEHQSYTASNAGIEEKGVLTNHIKLLLQTLKIEIYRINLMQ